MFSISRKLLEQRFIKITTCFQNEAVQEIIIFRGIKKLFRENMNDSNLVDSGNTESPGSKRSILKF